MAVLTKGQYLNLSLGLDCLLDALGLDCLLDAQSQAALCFPQGSPRVNGRGRVYLHASLLRTKAGES